MISGAVLQAIGLAVLASFGCWQLEAIQSVHPAVKRGVQVALCVVVGVYIANLFGVHAP